VLTAKLLILMVARDGIEPPTPAFSGPRSTTELSGLGVPRSACARWVWETSSCGGDPAGGKQIGALQTTSISIATARCRAKQNAPAT
jgi:hypothetical protein